MKFVRIVYPESPLNGLRAAPMQAKPGGDPEPAPPASVLYRLLENGSGLRGMHYRAGDMVWLSRHHVSETFESAEPSLTSNLLRTDRRYVPVAENAEGPTVLDGTPLRELAENLRRSMGTVRG